jgi:hypothetical protein
VAAHIIARPHSEVEPALIASEGPRRLGAPWSQFIRASRVTWAAP